MPDDYAPAAEEALEEARKLLAAGRPFHAHEVLEARWKTGPDEEREMWQGLAQICVGLTHIQRGNFSGAAALLTRGSARLGAYGSTRPYRLDLRALAVEADAVTTAIDEGNADAGSAIAAILTRLTPAPPRTLS
ncbi:DUF309 domain-containing protein [Microbispora rosea]|uniref:DUF309 domain-containing protein n=1 Tax=Microbispora rosea TaxID=58117 RepID=UPI0034206FFB